MEDTVFKRLVTLTDNPIRQNQIDNYTEPETRKQINELMMYGLITIQPDTHGDKIIKQVKFYEAMQAKDLKIWMKEEDAIKAKKLNLIESSISTNKSSVRIGWVSAGVAFVTLILFGYQIYRDITHNNSTQDRLELIEQRIYQDSLHRASKGLIPNCHVESTDSSSTESRKPTN